MILKKASLLNAALATVFTKEDITNIPGLSERPFQNILDNVVINQERLKNYLIILRLKNHLEKTEYTI